MRFSPETAYYLNQGELIDAYRHFGAHPIKDETGEVRKVRFTVYAPNARRIDVVGSFNDYALGAHPMEPLEADGMFGVEIPGNLLGEHYKYAIETPEGERLYKADPYAFYSALRPDTPSVVVDLEGYAWGDDDYLRQQATTPPYQTQVSIYELHLGTWMRKPDGSFHSYKETAEFLVPYLKEQGFTHVELMPVMEHPFDGSWGYQGTGYFSVTSRYGSPHDFMAFVDRCHQAGIGVLLDWVPGHICKDAHGLYRFDGSFLYEYDDADIRENEVWGTANLDLGTGPTRSFLISCARFFMDVYHIDGFRLDAVSNILYYKGEPDRGVNEGGIGFLRELSKRVFAFREHAILAAEDSSAFPKVTHPVEQGGIGFNYKWNMGWMNDTLTYFARDPIHRKHHHDELTFSLMYAFSENFILPFSHDEVVHGKRSLVDKMPGDYWQKFANYRALMGYLFTHPGKTLLFMGGEFAQMHEWKDDEELDWHLLEYPMHAAARRFVRDFNHVVAHEPALYELDHDPAGFEWIDADNAEQSIFSFIRRDGRGSELLILLNLTPNVHERFRVGVAREGTYRELIGSDKEIYGGSGLYNGLPIKSRPHPANGRPQSLEVLLPALSITVLRWEG